MPDKVIGFTRSSYPALPALRRGLQNASFRNFAAKVGQRFGVCKFLAIFFQSGQKCIPATSVIYVHNIRIRTKRDSDINCTQPTKIIRWKMPTDATHVLPTFFYACRRSYILHRMFQHLILNLSAIMATTNTRTKNINMYDTQSIPLVS